MDIPTWLQSQLNWQEEPGLWLAGSFLLYVLASNAAWLLRHQRSAIRLQTWPGTLWLITLLCWAYFVGPPYAALLLGVVSPRWLGLSEVDWVGSMGMGGAIAAAALGLLGLGWWSYRRALPRRGDPCGRPGQGQALPLLPRPLRWLLAIIETAALQAHWAFYRSVFIVWLEELHWGSWAGLGLVCLEWALNPWLQRGLRRPTQAEPILRRAVLALVTTALFILTRNLWLCWALHGLFEAGVEYTSRQVNK